MDDKLWLITVIETRTYEQIVRAPTKETAEDYGRKLKLQDHPERWTHTELSDPIVEEHKGG